MSDTHALLAILHTFYYIDVGKVQTMDGAFAFAEEFDSDIGGWDSK
jgi:hypothetical protein